MSKPVGARCNIRWKDDGKEYQVYIHFGDYDDFDDTESHIFFFCENEEELKTLDEEFEILDYELVEEISNANTTR
jgi:hypothetical protein|tara:strand:+ start:1194 stop:1418 length:225 start_codon:yes stop_codon:yes gene_type:complete